MIGAVAVALALGAGVRAEAHDATRRVLFELPAPAFALAADESIHPALAPQFQVELRARLLVERAGRYRFAAVVRGGTASLAVGGRSVGDDALELAAGERTIAVTFQRGDGPALLRLEWSSELFGREPIPARLFHHDDDEALAAGAAIERGRRLASERGCLRCHPSDGALAPERRAPDLSRIGARTSAAWIERWLADPRALRPTATMPTLALDDAQRRDVAAFLATLGRDTTPAVPADAPSAAPPAASVPAASVPAAAGMIDAELAAGRAAFADVGCSACHARDGADLGDLRAKTSEAALVAFLLDPLAVDRSGRMPALFARTGERAKADAMTARAIARFLRPAGVESSQSGPGDPARGLELVRYSGCLACHELDVGGDATRPGAPLPNEFSGRPLSALDARRGCLADWSEKDAPEFGFKLDERRDLRAFVDFARAGGDRSRAPAFELAASLARFRCTSCHPGFDGGPRAGLAETPPPLDVVGAKMRSSWLEGVLCNGTRVRPWLHLRMPDFGAENVRPLVAQFAAAAGVEPGDGASEPTTSRTQKLEGVKLLGAEGGLSCISCHDFRDYESVGSRGPDLTTMHARLRPEWFELWMRQPLRLIPGTSMPRYFDGADEETTRTKLATLWAGLQFGDAMPPPPGLVASAADTGRSQPSRRPLLQRTFMPESSPASIALALPGMVNCCFDTVECRVRYAWDGDFLDMRPQWAVKGEALPKLLGTIFWRTTSDFGVRIGDPAKPPLLRFRGHRLRDGLPELYYDIGDIGDVGVASGAVVRVDEQISAAPSGLGLVHRFRVGPSAEPVYFVARGVSGGKATIPWPSVEAAGADTWLVHYDGPVEFTVAIEADERH